MRFLLQNANTPSSDSDMNKSFASMEELLAWVEDQKFDWSSLVVVVLRKGV